MKAEKFAWMILLTFALAACGRQEPEAPTEPAGAEPEVQLEEPVADEPAAEEEAADEALEVVEESAAEPEETADETIMLAPDQEAAAAAAVAPPPSWKFKEGEHFARLVPTQPTVGGADKIEVAEFFWYGCPHCYSLEPTLNAWEQTIPPNVRFVRVPAMWNNVLRTHAQLYYTEEVLGRNGVIKDTAGFREAVFQEYHRRGNRLLSEESIQRLFARYGVSEEDFRKTWGSFEVAQKLRIAQDLAARYGISHVPMIVVNGKFRTDVTEAGGMTQLTDVIDELVARESVR